MVWHYPAGAPPKVEGAAALVQEPLAVAHILDRSGQTAKMAVSVGFR